MCFSWFDVVFMRVCFNSTENQMEIIYTFKAVFVKTHFHHLKQQKSIKTIIKKQVNLQMCLCSILSVTEISERSKKTT